MVKTPFQTSSIWDYDATAHGDGHNMLVIGYDRSDKSPSRWYFILKNSWGGDKYYLVSYAYMRNALRGGVVIMDVVDPRLDQPVSLVRGGAWLGIWTLRRGGHNDLDGKLVIRRTFDPNLAVQPKPGTDLALGEFFPENGAPPRAVTGHLASDRAMVFRVAAAPGAASPPHPADANGAVYTWAFGGEPARAEN
ncbi:MAG TPA: hypothetical protein VII40_07480 [Xanthobacteraceae bacterium]